MNRPRTSTRDIVERLNRGLNAVVKRPDIVEKMQSYGYAAEGSTASELYAINRDDLATWRKLIAEARLELSD